MLSGLIEVIPTFEKKYQIVIVMLRVVDFQ